MEEVGWSLIVRCRIVKWFVKVVFLRVKQIEDASTTTSPIVTLITREYQLVVSVLPFLQEPDCSHELLIDVNCQQLQTSATQKRTLKITQTKNKKEKASTQTVHCICVLLWWWYWHWKSYTWKPWNIQNYEMYQSEKVVQRYKKSIGCFGHSLYCFFVVYVEYLITSLLASLSRL